MNRFTQADPALSQEVALLRTHLDIPHATPEVVVEPVADSYEPNILHNGKVVVGRPGVEDFEERFGFIEGINPTQLLVGYYVVKHGLRDRYKRSASYSALVDETASVVEQLVPQTIKHKRLEYAADIVIGRLSTICAVARVACGMPKQMAALLPGRIMSGAEKKTQVDPSHKKAQKEVMRHLGMGVGGREDAAIRKLLAPARPK